MRAGRAGFTLIEILVVIAILAVLAGLIFPALGSARRSADSKAAKATIERLKLACESYAADFGDYPPTRLGAAGNGVNEGVESLLRHLTTQKGEHAPYFEISEKDLANSDGDRLAGKCPAGSTIEAKDLFELLDPWGNPFFYFHHRDYRGGAAIERHILASGERVAAKPRQSAKTGQYPNLNTFLVWSAGPNGTNEDGQGDDVCSWK